MIRSPAWLTSACLAAIAASTALPTVNAATPPGFILTAADGVTASEAWARATPGGATSGAVYLMLRGGSQPDTLVSVSTQAAATAEVHESFNEKGVMKMRPVASVPIPPGGMVALAPGGFHIMLTGLPKPLAAGQTFPLTLQFQHAAPVTVQVGVRSLGGKPDSGMGNMKM